MRVVLVSPTGAVGGAEQTLVGLAGRLPGHGIAVRAVLLEDGPLRPALEAVGVEVTVASIGRTRDPRSLVRGVRAVGSALAGADVVVSNHPKGHVHGGVAARLHRLPAVLWQHGLPDGSVLDRAAGLVPAAVVVCPSASAVAAQRTVTPRRRIETIPSCIDVARFATAAGSGAGVREREGWGEAPVVGIVGRLQAWKGQEVFLRAAALVAAERPDARFAVVGGDLLGSDAAYAHHLEVLAAALGIDGRVRFTGHEDDVRPWYDAMDVVVHASSEEAFGLVIVEAMALGRAVIASSVGGPTEIIEDGVSGLLVAPGVPERLAEAILGLLGDPARRAALGVAAAARAPRFSLEAMADDFARLLVDVAGARRG